MEWNAQPESSDRKRPQQQYARIPVWTKIENSPLSPWDLYLRTRTGGGHSFLLESGKAGRYSYVGGDPLTVFQAKNGRIRLWKAGRKEKAPASGEDGNHVEKSGCPLDALSRLLAEYRSPRHPDGLPPFLCGMVGFVSYDLGRMIERLPEIAADDLAVPDFYLMEPSWVIVKDHKTNDIYLSVTALAGEAYPDTDMKLQTLRERIGQEPRPEALPDTGTKSDLAEPKRIYSLSKDQFESAVERIREYIRAGDVFQVNLSLRESRPIRVPPQAVYEELRQINPSPYMGLLEFPELALVSCSPELLVRLRGDLAETRPIAGTRKRSGDRNRDLRMLKELIENEKERAEHIMLVDLERNDLGRVCEYGSVRVDELMAIEEYSHVMHIVSHVTGRLRKGMGATDLLAAVFPGGTITGAPKIRSMEIIEELEPVRRGVYTGSFGWWSFAGDMELNIAIRTMVIKDGRAHVHAGAGVVIDSVPEREYYESLRKAKALWQAFDRAHRGAGVPS